MTEGAITNLFFEVDGYWLTPSLDSGVLPGVQRAAMLGQRPDSREGIVDLPTLSKATAIHACNAVRGVLTVKKIDREDGSIVWESPSA